MSRCCVCMYRNEHCILCAVDVSRLCVHVCVRSFAQVCVIKGFLHDLLPHCVLPDSSACLLLVLCTYIGSLTLVP